MPPLTDLALVRTILDRDRAWAAYAIGDLAPGFVEHCTWLAPADGASALVLLYRGFVPPIVLAMGAAAELRALFDEVSVPEISLHLQEPMLAALAPAYTIGHLRRMRRMMIRPERFCPARPDDVRELGERDAGAVCALYADGEADGEGPTFFHPSMLAQRTFRGVWEEGTLVAIAGSHLYSRAEGVCTIGNVYTRRDRRGRGLAARVTSAVVAFALAEGVRTIVLNVGRENMVAARVYERLGFEFHCDFVEGIAHRVRGGGVDSSA